ncbi:hypothetical protein ACFL56_02695 [Candidatus Margulisiibacteriota bacterium]
MDTLFGSGWFVIKMLKSLLKMRMVAIKKKIHQIMENWGYAVIGFGVIFATPIFLYYIYLSNPNNDTKFVLYLANAFVIAFGGIILFFFVHGLEPRLQDFWLRITGIKKVRKPINLQAAKFASQFYYIFIPGLLVLNIPVLSFGMLNVYIFNTSYWLFFAGVVAVLQVIMYFHHRRYLSIFDSKPLRHGEVPGGFFSYLILSSLLCLMITPVIQFLFQRLVR